MLHNREAVNLVTKLVAIDRVSRRVPTDLREPLVLFYSEILALRCVSSGGDSAEPNRTLRFRSHQLELCFSLGDAPAETKGRVILEVNSLEEVARRFDEHGVTYDWLHGMGLTDQWIHTADPARHLVILRQTWPF